MITISATSKKKKKKSKPIPKVQKQAEMQEKTLPGHLTLSN